MVPQQKLHFFLPRLYFKLLGTGMSKEAALSTCSALRGSSLPPAITTLEEYPRCWIICHAMEGLLTTLDDGSEAARWCTELALGIIKFVRRPLRRSL